MTHKRNVESDSYRESIKNINTNIKETNRKKKLLGAKLQKIAVRYEGVSRSYGSDLDALDAFMNRQSYQGFSGKGKNKKLKFESTGDQLKLHGHVIASHTPKGLSITNAKHDTPLTYSVFRDLGIKVDRLPEGKVQLHDKVIDALGGENVLVPYSVITGEAYVKNPNAPKPKQNRTVTEQNQFRVNVTKNQARSQGRTQLPFSEYDVLPSEQETINKLTGIKSKIPEGQIANEAHHLLPVKFFPGLKTNPANGIMLTRQQHKEVHDLNKGLFSRTSKLKQRLAERYRAFTNTSSFVGNMRYDQDEQSMTGILSGKHYKWCGVPERTFDAFQGAGSAGAFFNRNVKGQFDCSSGGILNEIQSRISKLQKTAGIFPPDPADPNYAIETADYEKQREMADIEYPLIKKFKNYRENKFAPTTKEIDGGTYDAIKDQMPNIPASRVTGTSPTGESELDMKIRKDVDMLDFVPGQKSEEEVDRELKVMSRGPFDEKYLHPEQDDVDVDTEVEWNLDEYAEGADFEERTYTTVNDKTMQSIYNLLEKAETEYDPRAREQAKIKLMQYMPLGDNNPDDILDYILENGIDSLSSPNIFGVSLKNADRYAKLKRKIGKMQRVAVIEPLVKKKKKGRVIKKVSPRVAMQNEISKETIRRAKNNKEIPELGLGEGRTYIADIDRFLDAFKPEDADFLNKRYPGKGKFLAIISTTTNIDDIDSLEPYHARLREKGIEALTGFYRNTQTGKLEFDSSYAKRFNSLDEIDPELQVPTEKSPTGQESALVITPDNKATLYFNKKYDAKQVLP